MNQEIRRLARQIGIDVDDPVMVALLERDALVASEAALLLNRSRHALDMSFREKLIQTRDRVHGEYTYRTVSVRDLLEWAVTRKPRYRYVDEERARRYAEEDMRDGQ